MSEQAKAARAELWRWIDELADPDPDQQRWKRAWTDGMLLACGRVAVLDDTELEHWRAIADGARLPATPADRAAARRHLEGLLAALSPLRREPTQEEHAASLRFHGALEALHESGILDDEEDREWRRRALAATAPWLEAQTIAEMTTSPSFHAIAVPAADTAEQVAIDREMAALDLAARRGSVVRVLIADGVQRHAGVAVTAAVARTDATELCFHAIGPPEGDDARGLASFRAFLESLAPPDLRDETGTTYAAVTNRPVGAQGAGGTPDPERPQIVTGTWRYQPAMPLDATSLLASVEGSNWVLR